MGSIRHDPGVGVFVRVQVVAGWDMYEFIVLEMSTKVSGCVIGIYVRVDCFW